MKPFYLVLLCAVFITINQSISATNYPLYSQDDSTIVISPIPGNNPDPPIPRTPVIVPISASYESLLTSVILYFSYDLGEIEVEVLNTYTGGYDSGIVDTQYLSAIIPITLGIGYYIITFTLPSGQKFQGEFNI